MTRINFVNVLFATLLAIVLVACGGGGASYTPSPPPDNGGTYNPPDDPTPPVEPPILTIRVIDTASAPVAEADVSARRSTLVWSDRTGSDGRAWIILDGLDRTEANEVTVEVHKEGYQPASRPITLAPQDDQTFAEMQIASVGSAPPLPSGEFRLYASEWNNVLGETTIISGTLFDLAGNPITNAPIGVEDGVGGMCAVVTSNGLGEFTYSTTALYSGEAEVVFSYGIAHEAVPFNITTSPWNVCYAYDLAVDDQFIGQFIPITDGVDLWYELFIPDGVNLPVAGYTLADVVPDRYGNYVRVQWGNRLLRLDGPHGVGHNNFFHVHFNRLAKPLGWTNAIIPQFPSTYINTVGNRLFPLGWEGSGGIMRGIVEVGGSIVKTLVTKPGFWISMITMANDVGGPVYRESPIVPIDGFVYGAEPVCGERSWDFDLFYPLDPNWAELGITVDNDDDDALDVTVGAGGFLETWTIAGGDLRSKVITVEGDQTYATWVSYYEPDTGQSYSDAQDKFVPTDSCASVSFIIPLRGGGPPPPNTYRLTVDTTPVAGGILVNGTLIGTEHAESDYASGTSITLSFGSVAGYTTPPDQHFSITGNVSKIGTYTVLPPNQYQLTVDTEPVAGEISVNGQTGTGHFEGTYDSGTFIHLTYGDVPNYRTPDGDDFVITTNTTKMGTYVYVPPDLDEWDLTVDCDPDGIGAPIDVDWSQGHADGTDYLVVPNIKDGQQVTITFGDVTDYLAPDPIVFTITSNVTKMGTYEYDPPLPPATVTVKTHNRSTDVWLNGENQGIGQHNGSNCHPMWTVTKTLTTGDTVVVHWSSVYSWQMPSDYTITDLPEEGAVVEVYPDRLNTGGLTYTQFTWPYWSGGNRWVDTRFTPSITDGSIYVRDPSGQYHAVQNITWYNNGGYYYGYQFNTDANEDSHIFTSSGAYKVVLENVSGDTINRAIQTFNWYPQ